MGKIMKAITGIFKGPKLDMPSLKMPDLENPAAKFAARKKMQSKQGGRESTIYSQGTYSGQRLGGTG